jgi:hypothetical protein
MGLDITVGVLLWPVEEDSDREYADFIRTELHKMNDALANAGLPVHSEPESGNWEPMELEMWGYSGLHYLRRVAAHLCSSGTLPEPSDDPPETDPLVETFYEETDYADGGPYHHLMWHSDAEGFYVPVPFSPVVHSPDVVGEFVGSSHSLLRETEALAFALEIPEELQPDDEALLEAAEARREGETLWRRYGIETFSCVLLRAAARSSMERGAAIVFH